MQEIHVKIKAPMQISPFESSMSNLKKLKVTWPESFAMLIISGLSRVKWKVNSTNPAKAIC